MILQHRPPLHLTYCLNVHPGESWTENFAAIRDKALAVKQRIAPDQWFGLGLRLSQQAASQLASDPALVDEARNFFSSNGLYAFSVNAFPFGQFHSTEVKSRVYSPDWRQPERRDYTTEVADAFLNFLPPGVDGSISTVPGSYKPWIESDADKFGIAKNLAAVVAYLSALRDDTGQEIHIGLEPEPDCFLETTGETINFFKEILFTAGVDEVARLLHCDRAQAEVAIRRHLGVCLDTCHVALQYEDPLEALRAYKAEDIRISKIQLSAALVAPATPETWEELKKFNEPVYLHQAKALMKNGSLAAWYDLPDAIREGSKRDDLEEVRVHFHVPLFFNQSGVLGSTAVLLTPDFFHELRSGICSHLEIETYTFDVLPPELRNGDVVRSIGREYSWVMDQLGAH
jgi:sugar phosphate isomerase/epimerase